MTSLASGMSHSETAELILQRVENDPGWYGDTPAMETLARAQVHATLALVDALRSKGDDDSAVPLVGSGRAPHE